MWASTPPVRVAVVGSGPAGVYVAEALATQQRVPVSVDILERLPTPFGLVRHGVAPDHQSIRSAKRALEKSLARPNVRFFGNIEVGSEVSIDELRRFFAAIVFAHGAVVPRPLGIPGEDLTGNLSATDLVRWYCGHPDAPRARVESVLRAAGSAVVVGMGNVAVDVTRILAKTAGELEHTEMPQHVLESLATHEVAEIHVLGRRGPAHASFTTKELRELGELADADVIVDADDLVLDPVSEQIVASDRVVARNLEVLRGWSARTPAGRRRRIRLHFFSRPVAIKGPGHVTHVAVERTAVDASGAASGTGETRILPAQLVVTAAGFRGAPIEGLSFDDGRGVVPHDLGRVTHRDGPERGSYAAGWIKRGPSGVIGTNKRDAAETVASLLADVAHLPAPASPDPVAFSAFLRERVPTVVTVEGWRSIDAAEIALGARRGRERTLIHDRAALLEAAGVIEGRSDASA